MLENTIGKKWLKIEISPHEDAYESLPFIYYKEAKHVGVSAEDLGMIMTKKCQKL